MHLIDTNIWLERLLAQAQSEIVGEFLNRTSLEELCISDFTLHSIALALTRRNQQEAFLQFIQDVFVDGNVTLIRLPPEELQTVLAIMQQQNLDYDDAYQYTISERYDLILVSFDTDFDTTDRGRQTPSQVLSSISS